jgi:hypothetical protein
MAITLLAQRKRQKYLIPLLIVIILSIGLVLWKGFITKEELPTIPEIPEIVIPTKKIEIDFRVLENPLLEELQPFEEISPLEQEPGREHPFFPYE